MLLVPIFPQLCAHWGWRHWGLWSAPNGNRRLWRGHRHPPPALQQKGGPSLQVYIPVVPFTTSVVTAGFTAETVTGVTRRTPPMGTVRRMVPGCPGAPFSTTWNDRECPQSHSQAVHTLVLPPSKPLRRTSVACWGRAEQRAWHASPGSLPVAHGQWQSWEQQ